MSTLQSDAAKDPLRHLDRVERHPGASDAEVSRMLRACPGAWPEDYLRCLRQSNGLEGYVGGRGYLWLWSTDELPDLNAAYHTRELAPGVVLFGSDAGPIGFGFDMSQPNSPVVGVELNALHRDFARVRGETFTAFVASLAAEELPPGADELKDHCPPDWLRGMIIHEQKPIALGGDPADPGNRVLVPRKKHPELSVFWSRVVHRLKAETSGA